MDQFLQIALNGLAIGCVYALVALGMVLVYEATGIVNYAGALLAMALFGIVFFLLVHRPLQNQPVVTVIIATVAIGIVVQNVAQTIWGPLPMRPVSPFGRDTVAIGTARITVHALAVIGVTAGLVAALYAILFRTPIGVRMRAVAQDPEAGRLMGISVTRIYAVTWVVAAVLAGIAGIMLGPIWLPDVGMGDSVALKAFAAAIIGGFGSVPGAIVGGVVVGLAEGLGSFYLSSTYKELVVFGLMIGFLLLAPQGLFGERIGQRG
jgi:branched-chain amino acid transport system permease protein